MEYLPILGLYRLARIQPAHESTSYFNIARNSDTEHLCAASIYIICIVFQSNESHARRFQASLEDVSLARMGDRNEPLLLLHLPAEILQTIAWHMDPGTFFISLLTCKTMYDAAKYRRNLLRHLHSIPGLRLGLEDLTTADLFLRFRKRAAASLCGAGVLADITRYAPAETINSISKAVFSSGTPAQLATVHESVFVKVYELTVDHVRLKAELRIQSREDTGVHEIEVLKIAFSSTRDLAVLYKHKRAPMEVSPFVEEESTRTKCTLRLVTFHYCSSGMRGHFYSTDEQETTDISQDVEFEPAGLALASNGNFCISWTSSDLEKHPEVWLCGRDKKLMAALHYGTWSLCDWDHPRSS